ncbi:unnamed protein product [Symbiodinium pilosum]|uniref:Uncharacterized protein n=1 Tax=Symbiodinium pilosum TaxID=2952 RepID=A0A812WBH0_SYMPI|nr:unnamed protein product [Symbiodinium pilosum]
MEALLLQEAARAEAAARLEQEARSPIDAWRARDAALASEKAAKEAALAKLCEERRRLVERINFCKQQDSRWWPEAARLQAQLAGVQQAVQSIEQEKARAQQAQEQKADPCSRFTNALKEHLRQCENRTCPLAHLHQQPVMIREWRELVLSRIIRKSTQVQMTRVSPCVMAFEITWCCSQLEPVRVSRPLERVTMVTPVWNMWKSSLSHVFGLEFRIDVESE